MNTSIFSDYYNYKIKTVFEYSILLSRIIGIDNNKLFRKKKDTEEVLKWVISNLFDNYNNKNNSNIIRLFINDKSIAKYNIDNELVSTINYFIANQRAFEIKAYEKEIVLTASIIKIANIIDISTSPYKENKNNYKTIFFNCLDKFNNISYFKLIDNSKKKTNAILELIKDKVKYERKIFDTLNSYTSFNKYVSISSDGKYYLSQYNYSVPNLKNVDDSAAKYIYQNENIDDELVLISKDLVLITLMKLLSIRKLRNVLFIPIKIGLFKDEKKIKELSEINKNNIVSKYVKVLINYNEHTNYVVSILEKYELDYYVYCSRNTKLNDNYNIKKYLFSNDFVLNNQNIVNELINDGKEVIIENFRGILLDEELTKESEEL